MGSTELIRRRMMAVAQDYYKGWVEGYKVGDTGDAIADEDNFLSPMLPVQGRHRIKWSYNATNTPRAQFYSPDDSKLTLYLMNGERTVTVPALAVKIQLSFPVATIDNCYLLDETDNVYIFKGKNVII